MDLMNILLDLLTSLADAESLTDVNIAAGIARAELADFHACEGRACDRRACSSDA